MYCICIFISFLVAVIKYPDEGTLREKSLLWRVVPYFRASWQGVRVLRALGSWSCYIHSREQSNRCTQLVLHSVSLLSHRLEFLPRECCHSQWAILPTSANTIKINPHRHMWRPISQVILTTIKLTINNNVTVWYTSHWFSWVIIIYLIQNTEKIIISIHDQHKLIS